MEKWNECVEKNIKVWLIRAHYQKLLITVMQSEKSKFHRQYVENVELMYKCCPQHLRTVKKTVQERKKFPKA